MATKVNGVSLVTNLGLLREVIGSKRIQDLAATCPPETRQLVARTIVGAEWVPLDHWGALLQRVYDDVLRGDEAKFRKLLRAACQRDFTTSYRGQLNNLTPLAVVERLPTLWALFFDSGSLLPSGLETQGAHSNMVLQLRNLETNFTLFAISIHSYIEQVLQMTGARDIEVQRLRETLFGGRLSCDYRVHFASP
jgi:hypothetical protein